MIAALCTCARLYDSWTSKWVKGNAVAELLPYLCHFRLLPVHLLRFVLIDCGDINSVEHNELSISSSS